MEEESEDQAEEIGEIDGNASKMPMVMMIFVGLNSLLTIGVLLLIVLKPDPAPVVMAPAVGPDGKPLPAPAPAPEGEAPEPELDEDGNPIIKKKPIRGPIEKMEDIVIQLRNPEFDRFARISFELELSDEDDVEYIKAYMPRLRDAYIGYLSDRSYEELRGSRGLKRVKTALSAKTDELIEGNRVKALYVTNFVIQ